MPPFNASFIAIGVLCFAPIALAPTILVQTSLAQTSQPRRATPAPGRGASGRPAASPPTQDPPFDVHDLSGFWRGGGIRYGQGMRFSLGTPAPPMTAWAQARYDAAIPGIGAGGNKPDNPRAKPLGNDPIMICDPVGYPRIILTAGNHGIQIVQKPKEMIWLFAWFYARRIVWADGRRLPKDPEPRFYGYSAGRWEGNTFVVVSSGFDDRSWLDDDGHPVSDAMKLTERYHRIDHDTIEFTMTVTDPKSYTQPWTSASMYLHWSAGEELGAQGDGWEDLREDVCIPSVEARYKELVREPAGAATQK